MTFVATQMAGGEREGVLARALALAVPEERAPTPEYGATQARKITRRGIMWLGQTCNLRCHFCYFLDRIEDPDHPEHPFMSVEKAKTICSTLVDYYGNNSIDIQGGEPTLWPGIFELLRHCDDIGLAPTLITNAQALHKKSIAARYVDSGLRDFLISVQALGPAYDAIVGRPGAHELQMRALRNLQELGIPFRFNTVVSRAVLPQLPDIAELTIRSGAKVINFLGFNPFHDQRTGRRSDENVPAYGEVTEPLDRALDVLAAAGVEANVRYLPLCVVAERHRPSMYNFPQLSYDLHENDFASWSWTDLPAQRTRDAELTPAYGLGPRLKLGPLRGSVRRLAVLRPELGSKLHSVKQRLERHWASAARGPGLADQAGDDGPQRAARYREDARMRAQEYCGYRHAPACDRCDARAICDGYYADYADMFGCDDARPMSLGGPVLDPNHFTAAQHKVIHPDDREWLERG